MYRRPPAYLQGALVSTTSAVRGETGAATSVRALRVLAVRTGKVLNENRMR